MLRTRALTVMWAPWTRTWSSPCWRSPGWRRSQRRSWSWRPRPGCSGPYPALHVGSLARLVTAHQALPPQRRAVCTRALCGPLQCPGAQALHAALPTLAAPPAVVFYLASRARLPRTRGPTRNFKVSVKCCKSFSRCSKVSVNSLSFDFVPLSFDFVPFCSFPFWCVR